MGEAVLLWLLPRAAAAGEGWLLPVQSAAVEDYTGQVSRHVAGQDAEKERISVPGPAPDKAGVLGFQAKAGQQPAGHLFGTGHVAADPKPGLETESDQALGLGPGAT